jgi:hypothetical protein
LAASSTGDESPEQRDLVGIFNSGQRRVFLLQVVKPLVQFVCWCWRNEFADAHDTMAVK